VCVGVCIVVQRLLTVFCSEDVLGCGVAQLV
jgi:hypothetical protein